MAEHSLKTTNWYVIQVMTGNEESICRDIMQMTDSELYDRCFVPMSELQRKVKGKYISIMKPLFPGYLFIISDHIEKIQAALWKVAKFTRILRAGSTFVPLEIEEVQNLRSLTDKAFNITLSKGFIEGDQVYITEGPLKEQEGRIRKIDRHKRIAIVEMPFLGSTTNVRVPLEIAEKK